MGYWSENIYGNDNAMDLLIDIESLFKEKKEPRDIISEMMEKYCRNDDSILVIADFELFVFGEIMQLSKVLESADRLIEKIDDWDNPEKRAFELLEFKSKIMYYQIFTSLKKLSTQISANVTRTEKEISDWLYEKGSLDIFNIF